MEEHPHADQAAHTEEPAEVGQVPEEARSKPGRKPFYTHPRFGLATGIATLVSVPLAIYLAFMNVRKPELTYYLHPVRTKIVALDGDTRLQVAYDGKDIKGNVTALQLALWNAGDEPIRRADVLDRIRFRTALGTRILRAELRQVSRPVTGISLDETAKDLGVVAIDWTILEKNDGAALQILFEGEPDANFLVSGTVVNQAQLRERKVSVAAQSPEQAFREQKQAQWIPGIAVLIGMIVLLGLMFFYSGSIPPRSRGKMLAIAVLLGAALVLTIAALWMMLRDYTIPFSF